MERERGSNHGKSEVEVVLEEVGVGEDSDEVAGRHRMLERCVLVEMEMDRPRRQCCREGLVLTNILLAQRTLARLREANVGGKTKQRSCDVPDWKRARFEDGTAG